MKHRHTYDKLLFLFEEKHLALKRYLSITGEMDSVMSNSDLCKLRSLMAERQKYMRKIQSVDKSIETNIRSSKKNIDPLSHKLKGLLDRYRKEFIRIMQAAVPMDKKVRLLVKTEGQNLKKELLLIQKNKHAVSRYGSPTNFISRYLDTRK
jgi:hypothetical protein